MDCINSLLSVNHPCTANPVRGVYDITDIPAFTWGKIANISDVSEFNQVLNSRKIAYNKLLSAVKAAFIRLGGSVNDGKNYASYAKPVAGSFSVIPPTYGAIFTPHQECAEKTYTLESISFFLAPITPTATVSFTVTWEQSGGGYVSKAFTFPTIQTGKTITLSSSQITNNEGGKIVSDSIIIIHWDTATNVLNYKEGLVYSDCTPCNKKAQEGKCGTFEGGSVFTDIDGNVFSWDIDGEETNGLSISVTCACDFTKTLCNEVVYDNAANALLMLTEIELNTLSILSNRVNFFVLYNDKSELHRRKSELLTLVDIEVKNIAESMLLAASSNSTCGCIKCRGNRGLTYT